MEGLVLSSSSSSNSSFDRDEAGKGVNSALSLLELEGHSKVFGKSKPSVFLALCLDQ